ncbi:zinc finger BED domain-containing protein 1-like [Drosophila miranda]|uniref:zinc finger BED domain-containing protein 1-like n=1 Tax=Drosophila miranda TaxID=7229 RepID=UPI00143F4A54|nr:zinc finger BED domain-containing protein 1-like [Drosophila miranda]
MSLIRKYSEIWNHFEEVGRQEAKCKYCKSILSCKSQSNLSRHLKSKHPASMEPVIRQNTDGSIFVQSAQPKITSFAERPVPASKAQQIDLQLVRMIAKGHHALRLVEEPEFKKFIHDVSQASNYKLPTRKTLTSSLIPKIRDEYTGTIIEELRAATAVCLTTDGWTSITNESYLAVTVHFIDEESTMLTSYTLACQAFEASHTAANLCSFLEKIVTEWDLKNKVAALASHNAHNIALAIRTGNWSQIRCFAHTLNLIVQKALDKMSSVRRKAKAISEYFHRSSSGLKKLKDMQALLKLADLKLTQEVPTRWNSTFKMFERLSILKEAVVAALSTRTDLILSPEDWDVIDGVLPVLKPFYEVTEEISAEKNVTLSKIIALTGLLQRKMAQIYPTVKNNLVAEVINEIINEMDGRFNDFEANILYAESTVLDPRFKGRAFKSAEAFKKSVADINKKLAQTIRSLPEPPEEAISNKKQEEDTIWAEFDTTFQQVSQPTNNTAASIREMDKYLAEEYISRKDDPLVWWNQRKKQNIRKRRSLLKSTTVENLIFCITTCKSER